MSMQLIRTDEVDLDGPATLPSLERWDAAEAAERLRRNPEYQKALQKAKNRPWPRYEDAVDVEDLIARSTEDGDER